MATPFLTRITRKTERRVLFGEYECLIDRGLIINPPLIRRWEAKAIEEYIEFLRLLLNELGRHE